MQLIRRKVINPAVGLASEAYAHHRKKKEQEAGTVSDSTATVEFPSRDGSAFPPVYEEFDSNPAPDVPAADAESDEEDWALHEAAERSELHYDAGTHSCVPKGLAGNPPTIDDIVNAFLTAYPAHATGAALPCPVIIPQKRPGDKTRGFVHAYAPVLQAVGVSEQAWMDFMRSFEEAITVSPIFDAINIAANIAGLVFPSPAVMATSIAISVADQTAKQMYQRHRYNNFLAQLNAKFFEPLGLFVLVMTYDPASDAVAETFDLSTTIAKAERGANAPGIKATWSTIKGVQGKTRGEAQTPQAAELVFPTLDRPADARPDAWWKRSAAFVADYMDRRAQAQYAAKNPGTALATNPEFESAYGNYGIGGLTRRERRRRRHQHRYAGHAASGMDHVGAGASPTGLPAERSVRVRHRDGRGGPINLLVTSASGGKLTLRDVHPVAIVRRALKPGIAYLMITQMPTPEQIGAARKKLEIQINQS